MTFLMHNHCRGAELIASTSMGGGLEACGVVLVCVGVGLEMFEGGG